MRSSTDTLTTGCLSTSHTSRFLWGRADPPFWRRPFGNSLVKVTEQKFSFQSSFVVFPSVPDGIRVVKPFLWNLYHGSSDSNPTTETMTSRFKVKSISKTYFWTGTSSLCSLSNPSLKNFSYEFVHSRGLATWDPVGPCVGLDRRLEGAWRHVRPQSRTGLLFLADFIVFFPS